MVSVPVGLDKHDVPVGLAIIEPAWHEHLLVKWGSAIEDAVKGRRKPQFRNPDADNYMYVGDPQ